MCYRSNIICFVRLFKDTLQGPVMLAFVAAQVLCKIQRCSFKTTYFLGLSNNYETMRKVANSTLPDYMSKNTQLCNSAPCDVTKGLFSVSWMLYFCFFPKKICDGDFDHHAVVS